MSTQPKLSSSQLSHLDLLRVAGLFTWGCVTLALAVTPVISERVLEGWQTAGSWVGMVVFGAAYWQVAAELGTRHFSWRVVTLLTVLTGSALVVSFFSQTGLGGILLMVIAGLLPWLLPVRTGIAWLVAQNLVLIPLLLTSPNMSLSKALLITGLYIGFCSFTFVTSLVARRQAWDRQQLRKVNSELRATQALLAESTRIAERVRLSRELHDLVGHHLTALSLNLEVASHLVTGKAAEHVGQCQSLARLLLADVREVVSDMRGAEALDVGNALKTLADGVPHPNVHLSLPDNFSVEDPNRAQVLLRCVQEIITNTLRHAEAENLWIKVSEEDDGLQIEARDDGRGARIVEAGNGLRGMSERLRSLGGKLRVASNAGEGFELNAWLPRAEPAT